MRLFPAQRPIKYSLQLRPLPFLPSRSKRAKIRGVLPENFYRGLRSEIQGEASRQDARALLRRINAKRSQRVTPRTHAHTRAQARTLCLFYERTLSASAHSTTVCEKIMPNCEITGAVPHIRRKRCVTA